MSSNTNKSPYEIRLDILNLAQRICSDRSQAESGKLAQANNRSGVITLAPTTEEIIAEAEKLNNFISKSPNR